MLGYQPLAFRCSSLLSASTQFSVIEHEPITPCFHWAHPRGPLTTNLHSLLGRRKSNRAFLMRLELILPVNLRWAAGRGLLDQESAPRVQGVFVSHFRGFYMQEHSWPPSAGWACGRQRRGAVWGQPPGTPDLRKGAGTRSGWRGSPSGTEERMWGGLRASKGQSQDLNPGRPAGVSTPWEDLDPALKAPGIQVPCLGPCVIPYSP